MTISENESKLIAIFVQSCLWGAFAVMFALTYWTLVYRRPGGRPLNVPMLLVSILMFSLASMQLGINLTRIIRGFINYEGRTEEYYNVLAEFTQIFGSTTYVLQTFVGDGVAIYRCYIVWSRRLVFIIFPCILYVGSLITGIGILVTMSHAEDGSLVFLQELGHWIQSFFAFTLVTSVTCTLMISSRIWHLNNQSAREGIHRGSNFHRIARVVVESGAIYSGMLLALLILYDRKSWFQYIIVDAMSPLIGIVFSIIIVRIGLGVATDPDNVQGTGSSKTLQGSSNGTHELSTFEASNGLGVTSDGHQHTLRVGIQKLMASERSEAAVEMSLEREKSLEAV